MQDSYTAIFSRVFDNKKQWKERGRDQESATQWIRERWEYKANEALEKAGHSMRIDRRSLEAQREEALKRGDMQKAQELDRKAQIHIGVMAQKLAEKGIRPESNDNYKKIDQGRTRAEYNAEIISLNLEKQLRSRDVSIRTRVLFEKDQERKDKERQRQDRLNAIRQTGRERMQERQQEERQRNHNKQTQSQERKTQDIQSVSKQFQAVQEQDNTRQVQEWHRQQHQQRQAQAEAVQQQARNYEQNRQEREEQHIKHHTPQIQNEFTRVHAERRGREIAQELQEARDTPQPNRERELSR